MHGRTIIKIIDIKCFAPKILAPMPTARKSFSGLYLLYKYQEKAGNSYRIEAALFNIPVPERG
jgi:hypothetical protein